MPADLAGQHGRHEGRAALQPGAPGRAHRRPRRPVGLSRRGARAPPAGGRPVGRARRRGAVRDALRSGRGAIVQWLLHRALPPPARRRRLAHGRIGGARGRPRPAGRRDQRRPLRPARGSRAGRCPDRDPPRPDARDAGRPAPPRWRIVPEVRRGDGGHAAGRRGGADGARLGGGDRDVGRARRVVLGRSQLRAVPLPGVRGARRGDAVQLPRGPVPCRRPEALSPADLGGREAARPRARRDRAGRARRVLPDLLGPDALRPRAEDPGPGSRQCSELDRRLHPRDQPGRADRPQPPVRAVHQRGPDDLSRRRHRLQLGATGGGHPVHLQPLRAGSHRDGLQPRDVPGAIGGARGGLCAGVPAAARRSRGEGARDVRQRDGPARPRGRRRVRRVLPADGRGTPRRGTGGRGSRGARPGRRDGPAEHADPARREGAALAPAAEAGGPERAATVRLASGRRARPDRRAGRCRPRRRRVCERARSDARERAGGGGNAGQRRPARRSVRR